MKLPVSSSLLYQLIIQAIIIFLVFGIQIGDQKRITHLIILGMIALYIIEGNFFQKMKVALTNRYTLLFLSYIFLVLIGIFYSEDLSYARRQAEAKFSLMVFPIVLSSITLDRKGFSSILYTFIICCFFASLLGLAYGTYQYFQTGNPDFLYSDNLSYLIDKQAIYFSIYINLSIVFLFYFLHRNEFIFKLNRKIIYLLLLFFFFMSFLLASRVSMLTLYLAGFGYLIYLIKKEKKVKEALIAAGIFLILISGFLIAFPKTLNRFKVLSNVEYDFESRDPGYHFGAPPGENYWTGLTSRLAIWHCTWEIIEDNMIIGVGTGDVKNELFAKYKEKNFYHGLERQYSTHNQYLMIWLSSGVVGLTVFMAMLLVPARKAWFNGNYLFLIFLGIFMLAFLTENVFYRNNGAMLYALFNSLLFFQGPNNS